VSSYANTSKALIRKAVKLFGSSYAVLLPSGTTCIVTAILQGSTCTTELDSPLCIGAVLDSRLLVISSTRSAADVRHRTVPITHTGTILRLVDGVKDTFGRAESSWEIISASGVLLHRVSAATEILTLPSLNQGLVNPIFLTQDSVSVHPADRLVVGATTYQIDSVDCPLSGLLQLQCSQQL
jgi:hypothetical protein